MVADTDPHMKFGEFVSNNKIPHKQAFFIPAVTKYLKSEVLGKRVLDIGCGTGDWSYFAAVSGAKSVDGFDIQEEMVQLFKQATNFQFETVNIRVGNAMSMPYDDNSFDHLSNCKSINAVNKVNGIYHN